MEQAFTVRSVRQMSSIELISRWIFQETVLEQGFPSLTSTTVRANGNFFYLDTTLREEACHPFSSQCVFHRPLGLQEWFISDSSRTCGREVECLQKQEFSSLLPRDILLRSTCIP
uniref:Uncharacterized protein LOC111107954 n=1 Tax=Crassostrea virginica TaxID=6565 RepID=A0A8B8B7L1_CRAVI|nr:uncharacterized protein LOC111107954 [Crassostrea virginica]